MTAANPSTENGWADTLLRVEQRADEGTTAGGGARIVREGAGSSGSICRWPCLLHTHVG